MKKTGFLCAVFSLIAALMPSLSAATNYFVTTAGNNSNAGTSIGSPWLTIQKAATTMVAGDTVTVSAGTYAERVSTTTSGSAGNLITYLASGTVVTKGFQITASYVVVNGFEIASTVDGDTTGPGVWLGGTFCQVLNNYIHDTAREGVMFNAPSGNRNSTAVANNTVKGNTIVRAGMAGIELNGQNSLIESNDISHSIQDPPQSAPLSGADADGMRFFGSGHTIRKNNIHDILQTDTGNVDPHIDCFQTWGPATSIIVEQNLCHGNVANMQALEAEVVTATVGTLTFRNNVFYDMTRGLNISPTGPTTIAGFTAANNTFKNVAQQGVLLVYATNAIVQNNLFYNVGSNLDEYLSKDSTATGSTIGYNGNYSSTGALVGSPYPNDVWADPKIVDATANNFHLQSTSPLIGAGVTLAGVTNDYDAVSRPQGTGYDIGAFEYMAGVITPPSCITP